MYSTLTIVSPARIPIAGTREYTETLDWHMNPRPIYTLLVILALFTTNSCVWRPGQGTGQQPEGLSHTVKQGETLWSIAKTYGVNPAAIRSYNNIRNINDMRAGTVLFVPGGKLQDQPSGINLPPIEASAYRKWEYIVVHHSATDIGSAERFDKQHKDKGWRGIGYNFVINNGTCGRGDGEIEVTPRWTFQQTGAHCKASDMNENGIGICLVGNFSKSQPTQEQLLSLVNLIRQLQQEFNIPANRVVGHGRVQGANTECPGSRFPWATLRQYLL